MRIPNTSLQSFYKKQFKVAIFGFVCELPNLIYSIIAACFSNSILCWIDSVVSLSSTTHFAIMIAMTRKMVKESGDKYNYGTERLEVFTSFICELAILVAMLALLAGSIYGIIKPTLPSDSILWFMLLKMSNIAFDIYFVIKGYKLHKIRATKLTETELNVYKNNLIHDVLVGVTVICCYIFRISIVSGYLSPIVGIVSIAIFLMQYIKHMSGSFKELSDVSIPLDDQDNIYDIVLENKEHIKQINSVNCHSLNSKVYVDVNVVFKDGTTYEDQMNFLNKIKSQIQENIQEPVVRLVVDSETKVE